MKFLSLLAPALLLVSCAGYQLGGVKPASLEKIHTIAVPMFENGTLHPRAEALATSAVADAFVKDGTYKLENVDSADAVLVGKVSSIKYSAIRGKRLDTLRPEELDSNVTISWRLLDARDRTKVLARGSSEGSSNFFVDSNLQTARNGALPDALEQAAESLVSRLSNGY